MRESEKSRFLHCLDGVMAATGRPLNPAAVPVWWAVLEPFALEGVEAALYAWAAKEQKAPVPADIARMLSAELADGWPGADEAWALLPLSEYDSGLLTDEAAEAMGVALPLAYRGDETGARMAFRDAYNRCRDAAIAAGKRPRWFFTCGMDPTRRAPVLLDAVRKRRLPLDHCLQFLPGDHAPELLRALGVARHPLLVEHEQAGIERLRRMLDAAWPKELPAADNDELEGEDED
ncbi:hypothetical protein [Gloeobacter kilaueensis]|uniref:Uncharacterized protein n=1 Tax=Gloeobacter kilaueensis (strain ATCC BAA-2537 / CCAP 1431/1 / ULC 316 / JS1) TaxID=1183438 RepID=U5QDY6_GLOK1|nr:hypothetical protein [Gloeobacter kilaueensis]AGY57131.1 hypothetical protein GKIL_0885 [Gloeobacter kilaueensis JS1]